MKQWKFLSVGNSVYDFIMTETNAVRVTVAADLFNKSHEAKTLKNKTVEIVRFMASNILKQWFRPATALIQIRRIRLMNRELFSLC